MGWQFVGSTGGAGTSNGYTVSLNGTLTGGIASSPSAGDLVVVFSGFGNTASSAPAVSGNSTGAYTGATAAQHVNDTWDTEFRSFYAVMGETPDTTLTITRATNTAYGGATTVHVWRGVDTSSPFIGAATPASAGNTSLVNPPAYNPAVTGALIIAGGAGTQATTGAAFTGFTGMSNFKTQKGDGSTSDIDVAMASYAYAGVSYDPPIVSGGTGGNTSSSWAGVTIAFRVATPVAKTLTGSLNGAVKAARSATATLNGAVKVSRTATASANAAVSAASAKTASLSSAILQAHTAASNLAATIQQARAAAASLDASISAATPTKTAGASLNAAIRGTRQAATNLSAAVRQAKAAVSSLDSAISTRASLSIGLGAAVRQAFSISAALQGAVRRAEAASAGLNAFVFDARVTASVNAAISVAGSASAGLDAHIVEALLLDEASIAAIAAAVWAQALPMADAPALVYGATGLQQPDIDAIARAVWAKTLP